MNAFLKKLMDAAKAAGIDACEAYIVERDSFSAMVNDGEVTEYKSNLTRGLGFRGLKGGRMGYASTEAFDDEAVDQLVKGVVESAELCEDTDSEFLYDGAEPVPEVNLRNPELAAVSAQEKIECVKTLERIIKNHDARIDKAARNSIRTGSYTVRIVNSFGMDRSFTEDNCVMFGMAKAKDGEYVATGFYGDGGRSFDLLDPEKIGQETAKRAVAMLGAKPVPSGKYRVIIQNKAMTDLLQTFCGIFSAENAQKGLSLLKDRLGEKIAADCVNIVDDPLLLKGMEARPFDAEGVPSKAHTVVEKGMFRTFLHNLKTAHKDGVETTGNASKAGYASAVHVAPSNFYIQPGEKTSEELMAEAGEGLLITEVSGLHAGANAVSGDFSLLSKGYVIEDGHRGRAVEQITMAGNFYELLKNITAVASNLEFPGMGTVGSPSVLAEGLSIAGK